MPFSSIAEAIDFQPGQGIFKSGDAGFCIDVTWQGKVILSRNSEMCERGT